MCHFDSIVSLGVELDNQAFDQLRNDLLLFSVVMLSLRSFFTIWYVEGTKLNPPKNLSSITFQFLSSNW